MDWDEEGEASCLCGWESEFDLTWEGEDFCPACGRHLVEDQVDPVTGRK